MFTRINELINIHNLKHEIKEKDDSIWYIINGFKECPDDTISMLIALSLPVTKKLLHL